MRWLRPASGNHRRLLIVASPDLYVPRPPAAAGRGSTVATAQPSAAVWRPAPREPSEAASYARLSRQIPTCCPRASDRRRGVGAKRFAACAFGRRLRRPCTDERIASQSIAAARYNLATGRSSSAPAPAGRLTPTLPAESSEPQPSAVNDPSDRLQRRAKYTKAVTDRDLQGGPQPA